MMNFLLLCMIYFEESPLERRDIDSNFEESPLERRDIDSNPLFHLLPPTCDPLELRELRVEVTRYE